MFKRWEVVYRTEYGSVHRTFFGKFFLKKNAESYAEGCNDQDVDGVEFFVRRRNQKNGT
jgi:hypothetical protein